MTRSCYISSGNVARAPSATSWNAVCHFLEFGWVFAPLLPCGDRLAPQREVYRLYKGVETWEIVLLLCHSVEEHTLRLQQQLTGLAEAAEMEEIELAAGLARVQRFRANWCNE